MIKEEIRANIEAMFEMYNGKSNTLDILQDIELNINKEK